MPDLLHNLKPKKDYLICIDSDGCVINGMTTTFHSTSLFEIHKPKLRQFDSFADNRDIVICIFGGVALYGIFLAFETRVVVLLLKKSIEGVD